VIAGRLPTLTVHSLHLARSAAPDACRSGTVGMPKRGFRRCAKYGSGYMPLAYPADDAALAAFSKLRALPQEAERDLSATGLEIWVSSGAGNADDRRRQISFWKDAGVTPVTEHTTDVSGHHKRIGGRSAAEHLTAIPGTLKQWPTCCRSVFASFGKSLREGSVRRSDKVSAGEVRILRAPFFAGRRQGDLIDLLR